MKKLTFLLLTILIIASAHQAQAVSGKTNGKSNDNPSGEKRNENSIKHVESEVSEDDIEPLISVEPSPEVEDDEEEECEDGVKNHGEYVSCIAKNTSVEMK